jgi:SAM-dependent methyltransferase
MSDQRGGAHAALGIPVVYNAVTRLLGSPTVTRTVVTDYLRPEPGDRCLDIGCGTAAILEEMGPVEYTGFDPNPAYIKTARDRYGDRGRFLVGAVGEVTQDDLGDFDLVLAKSVLHHVDDSVAGAIFQFAADAIRPGGRLVTSDCCYTPEQSSVARFITSLDRGGHIRPVDGYEAIARRSFKDVTVHVRTDLLRIPYTHAILVCTA